MSTQKQSSTTTFPLIAAIATVFLIIGAIAIIALERLNTARGRHIEDVPQTPLTLSLVCLGLLLLAAGWLWWWARNHGWRHAITIVLAGATALLLVVTPLVTWRALGSERNLTVISMSCDAESLRSTGGVSLAECDETAIDTIVLLGGVSSDDQWVPDETTGNLTREFRELPAGDWETMLTVDGPPETVAVSVIGMRGDDEARLGNFRPYMDAESGRLRWTSLVRLNADISTVRVQFFLSANPAVQSASIRFEVKECRGQGIRDFDAAQCTPMESNAPLVMEKSPAEPRTWRHPQVTRSGTEMVITNLEARTYMLQPDYAGIEMHTQSTDVLIIPSAMPQVADNSVAVPGESVFEVPIESNTGELRYTIYVFPTGPTFADRNASVSNS